MKPNAYYIRALLGVMAFTTLVVILFARPQTIGNDFWQPSSFNSTARGHKALYTTLDELHWPVGRWQESYRDLSGTNQILIMARNSLGRRYNLEPVEIDQLLKWVAAGNHLILLGDFADSKDARPLLKQLNFPETTPLTAGDRLFEQGSQMLAKDRKEVEVTPHLPTLGGTRLSGFFQPAVLEQCLPLPSSPPNATILLTSPSDQLIYGIQVPHGKGNVSLIASSSLIDNGFLSKSSNLSFVIDLIKTADQVPAKIWFEEAHHGYRTSVALTDLFRHSGIKLAMGQILIGLLVFLSAQLFRFGPVRPLHRETGRSTLEFVNSLANLYRRANIRNNLVESLFEETHRSILRKFDLPERTSHDVIAQRLGEAFPHLPKWKKLAQRFDSTDYVQGLPPSGWLKVSRELILIKNAMI